MAATCSEEEGLRRSLVLLILAANKWHGPAFVPAEISGQITELLRSL